MTSPIQPETLLIRNPELVAADMDGETVMLDVDSGRYFGLDPVGSHIWELLAHATSAQACAASIKAEFAITEDDDVESDLSAFLAQLVANGLILEAKDR